MKNHYYHDFWQFLKKIYFGRFFGFSEFGPPQFSDRPHMSITFDLKKILKRFFVHYKAEILGEFVTPPPRNLMISQLSCPLNQRFGLLWNDALWHQTLLLIGQLLPPEHVSNIF